MRVYNSLTPEQLSKVGTDEYRQLFKSLDSVSMKGQPYDVLNNMLWNFMSDVSRIYICQFDKERSAMVYIAEVGSENPAFAGDWEPVSAKWIEKVTSFKNYT